MKSNKMRRILLKDMNDAIVCSLCNGYLIDATSLTECHHVFCRGCILRYFENCKTVCPTCNMVYKSKKNHTFFKSDPQIQSIVYKMVPGLYSKEMQRREDFYRSTGVRASSSCSDDSVLERERDMINDEEEMVSSFVGPKNQFFGPEDSISLSLEFYQSQLDTVEKTKKTQMSEHREETKLNNNNNSDAVSDRHKISDGDGRTTDKRFLQCPAAVTMKHLQKFVRMKFALTQHHQVDIIYEGEVLPLHFSLMDVAYTFKWKRLKPLRFFYRIFSPLKIQPIKIVNTALSSGEKQLQVVTATTPKTEPKIEENEREKERLLAHLQLQSKAKIHHQNVPEKSQDCIFDYEEPDKEEIKRFAESRDREWAMQKKLDEKEKDEEYHHFSKKRKKNKHSKNEFTYKKRKLHAEITNKEEELKLKVKLTPHNGHKHKHHKSSSSQIEVSSKEKLLQMRQIRHKHVSNEEVKKEEEVKTNGDLFKLQTKVPTVQIERHEQTEIQAKKSFLKSYPAFGEKLKNLEKNKLLEQKIANLQQRCTVEPKKIDITEPNPMPGFTVSMIDTITKRKTEQQEEKRPSLEITLVPQTDPKKPPVKRPPPATIPLDRIKKSLSLKSGLSIIPKTPEKCDNIGALDLSAKPLELPPNGLSKPVNMSNLQMLSKVAAEHPSLNKIKPKIPNLQTIRIPSPNQRLPPSLKMIDKAHYRMMSPQIRNLRPNQNQSIRNIPNPSLLVRAQQNRLNSMNNPEKIEKAETKEVIV